MQRQLEKMMRALLVLSFLGALGCREGKTAAQTAPPTQRGVANDTERVPAPLDVVLARANDEIESARIHAIGVPALGADVVRGFALPTYTELPDLSYDQMLQRIADVGATHVAIVTSWDQQTIYHNRIAPNRDKTPTDKAIGQLIDRAHELGMKTLVFPIIHVERRAEGEWRGRLAPTEIERWRQSYRDFVLHHADLATRHDAAILSIGSELSSQESATDFWTTLIRDVRSRYRGELLYSSNWDHYTHPKFWDQLDYIGVSSYFEVAKRNDEPIFAVTERWLRHRDQLLEYAGRVGKPLVLTEVGYPSIDSAAVKPWDYTARTPPNPNAQLAAFQSLAMAWSLEADSAQHFAGLFIWHGWGHGGSEDLSYPIWGKPAEDLVRRWYASPLP